MARLVRHFIEEPRACSYLPDLRASLEYRLMVDVAPQELEQLLLRGWRRFGPAYFRPACRPCGACRSIRLDVHRFLATRGQRKAANRMAQFEMRLGRPVLDEARLKLHEAWHATRETLRGWDPTQLTEDEYATQFAFPSATGREMAWYDKDRLVALGLVDITPNCVSAAYFFYAPEIAKCSPGVANVLACVELARSYGASHVYLGYRVEGCPSLEYKGRFRPHELLEGRPGNDEKAMWKEVGESL